MQCDYCDSQATVFFTQIVGGVSKKSCLCEKCALQNGVTDPMGFLSDEMNVTPMSDSDGSTAKEMQSEDTTHGLTTTTQPSDSQICPCCGFAFDDLKKTGRLGCSECYQFFHEEIKVNLGSMHKDTSHVGRVPAGMLQAFQRRQELEKLDQQMADAINDEDYEAAAAIRDQIQKLSAMPAEEMAEAETKTEQP